LLIELLFKGRALNKLPKNLKPLFWDYDFKQLSWQQDKDLIISRILEKGDWQSILWLRHQLSDKELSTWIIAKEGRGLELRQLRFWELILGLPHRIVNTWIKDQKKNPWNQRCVR
jgi:hypothetical protein